MVTLNSYYSFLPIGRSWTAAYICIGVASLSFIIVIGVVLSYGKLSATRHRILPVSSQQQPEVKRTLAKGGAIDPHRTTASVNVTAAGAVGAAPAQQQSRLAVATQSSILSSPSMSIQSDAESSSRRSL